MMLCYAEESPSIANLKVANGYWIFLIGVWIGKDSKESATETILAHIRVGQRWKEEVCDLSWYSTWVSLMARPVVNPFWCKLTSLRWG